MSTVDYSKLTQAQQIMQYMKEFGEISQLEAWRDLGISKLSTRVGELIQSGVAINKRPSTSLNRWGQPCSFMIYSLPDCHDQTQCGRVRDD